MKPNACRLSLLIGSLLTIPAESSALFDSATFRKCSPCSAGSARLVQDVGQLAEAEGHHLDISFGWRYATVSLSTKKIKGLHENVFIMASKIDRVLDRSGWPLDRQS